LFVYGHVRLRDLLTFPTRRSSDLVGRPVVVGRTVPLNGEHQFAVKVRLGFEGEAVPLALLQLDAVLFELDLPDGVAGVADGDVRSEEHTSELQSRFDLVCRLLLEK